jgi:hypothetical protein
MPSREGRRRPRVHRRPIVVMIGIGALGLAIV